MGIRPVDMQMVVHKSQETHHAKQNVVNRQDDALAKTQVEVREESDQKQKTVNESEKTNQNNVKNDQKKEKNASSGNKKKKKKKGEEDSDKKEAKDPFSELGRHFDMKV